MKINRATIICLVLINWTTPIRVMAGCTENAMTGIQEADAHYGKRLDASESEKALALYAEVLQKDASCTEAYWKAARASWWIADHKTTRDEKIKMFQTGIDYSKKAVALDSKSPAAHFWLAGNYGSFGESKGVMKSLFLVGPIRSELNEILKIEPLFLDGAAYRVLGVVDYKVPGIAGGSKKRALDRLNKAMEISPHNPFNLYYMAEYYFTVGDKTKARPFLDELANLTASGDDQPDLLMMQEKGQHLSLRINTPK